MHVPSDDDWRSEPWGIDTPHAHAHFFGKTIAEAVALFEESALHYQEDVMFMPGRVFGYYVQAYIAYLMSSASQGDSDGASCFIGLIDFKTEHAPAVVAPVWPQIVPVLERLAHQQKYFDAAWEIYGDFRARIHAIVERGFGIPFDTSNPEVVPASASLSTMAGTHRTVPIAVAVQVFRNSGINEITSTSTRQDIVRIFGCPDETGGGNHSLFGPIAEWIRYDRLECSLRFGFEGSLVSEATFMPPIASNDTTDRH